MIAVDANGADQGPARRRRGSRAARACPFCCSGPEPRSRAPRGPHAEIVDAPETIKAGEEAVAAVRSKRGRLDRPGRVGRGRRAAPTRSCRPAAPGRRWRPRRWPIKRIRGVYRPALAVLHADPRRAGAPARRGRERGGAPGAPRPVRLHGRVLHGGGRGHRAARGRACCRWARSPARARPTCSPRTTGSPRPARSTSPGNVEGFDLPRGGRRRGGGRRVHRQRRAQGARGHREGRSARRSARGSAPGRSRASAGC